MSEASSESPAPRIGVYLNEFFIFVDGVVLCKVFELPQALFLMFSSFYFEYPNQVKNVMHVLYIFGYPDSVSRSASYLAIASDIKRCI